MKSVLSIFCALCIITLGLEAQSQVPARQAATPLGTFLNTDGTLKTNTGFSGSLDTRGWKMATGKNGAPRFTPANAMGVPADTNWDGQFALPGLTYYVTALAVSGTTIFVGGDFTGCDGDTVNYLAKWDGSKWSALGAGMDQPVKCLAVSGTDLYAGGDFTLAGGVTVNYIAKWNGSSWTALGSGMNSSVNALAVNGTDIYAGGFFTTAGGVSANRIAKWNGSNWSALGSGMNAGVNALAVSDTTVIAGGSFTTAGEVSSNRVAEWNGSSWSALGSGMNNLVSVLEVSGTTLFAGGYFTTAGGVSANCIAKWDGSNWSALGSGMNFQAVNFTNVAALATMGTDIYAVGLFTTAGGVNANFIAKWDGSSWSALGSGLNNTTWAVAVIDSDIYAGGSFTTAGGLSANFIARWDGSNWFSLNSATPHNGLDGEVDALTVNGSDIYAGGWFTTAGGVITNRIAKWNGSGWSALGGGMNDFVSALAVSGTNVLAAGQFETAGGDSANSIAKWNGSNWSAFGSGLNSAVLALAVIGSDIYAGGWFTTAGGVSYIAKWDGSSWSALGSGTNGTVSALTVSGTDLYAGGFFTTAGAVSANYIAKWDGSSWSALGSGMNGIVYALAVSGTTIFAGGNFTTAGDTSSNYVAKWDGSSWKAMGSGLNDAVVSLVVNGTDLYVGGGFTTAGGTDANSIARWNGSSWSALGSGTNNYVRALAVIGNDIYASGSFNTAGNKSSFGIARWHQLSHSIIATSGIHGTISPSGISTIVDGDNQGYTFSPDSGYHVDSVFIDGIYVGSPLSYTFTNVTVDHTIGVHFSTGVYSTLSITVGNRWNLASVPLRVTNYSKDSLYGASVSNAFGYQGNYVVSPALANGAGYWLVFNNAQNVDMTGVAVISDSIDVAEGWNLVGSISAPLAVTSIGSIPGGIVTSRYFGYAGSYTARDTIEPGKGYWVKVNQAGKLILSSAPGNIPSNRLTRIVTTSELPPAPPGGGASNSQVKLPAEFGLEQNYPNPFNPTSVIRYELPVSAHVELKVYNVIGQEVGTLVDGVQDAGFKSVVWDASRLPSAVYYYRITAGSFNSTKKTILIK